MKQVIANTKPKNTVFVNEIDEHKLYFSENNGYIYKLHRIVNGWVFISMQNNGWRSSVLHETAEKAILFELSVSMKVYEFDSLSEVIKWFDDITS